MADETNEQACGTMGVPQKEHEWLQQLVGEWTMEGEATMGPGAAPSKFEATESVTSLGGLWVQGVGKGKMPDGTPTTTQMTLGYDTIRNQYVGTWIGTMMAYLWVYEGTMDSTGRELTLAADGPAFETPGKTAKYRDVLTIKSPDFRTLTSYRLGDDGDWHLFMTAHYHRKK